MIDTNISKLYCGDNAEILPLIPDNSIDTVITSPPYFQQREYGHGSGIGNEKTLEEYIENLMKVFRHCVRVIKDTGSIVFNIGDKYVDGSLLLVPYQFALAVQKERLVKLVNELTWVKINPVPKQDPRKLISATEPFFIFAKSPRYYFDKDAFLAYRDAYCNRKAAGNAIGKKYFALIGASDLSDTEKERATKELSAVIEDVKQGKLASFRMKIRGLHALPYGGQAGGRLTQIETKGFTIIKIYGNALRRDVIESTVETIKGNIHPAVYPESIVQELIKLLTKEHDIVFDPFLGSGTTAAVAKRLGRRYIGIELHHEHIEYAERRLNDEQSDLFEVLL
ncbi:MAG: site-specific DNA-methyltransferase [Treponema sp.]|jgi:site-specific DNA-methyltransferase (adenine-specific)|nr:site-specific DNA-methyltransferase [Treponema sp.]